MHFAVVEGQLGMGIMYSRGSFITPIRNVPYFSPMHPATSLPILSKVHTSIPQPFGAALSSVVFPGNSLGCHK